MNLLELRQSLDTPEPPAALGRALQGGRTAPEAKLLSKPFHLKDLVMEVDRIFQTEDQHGRL